MPATNKKARAQLERNVEVVCDTCGARRMVETTDMPPEACEAGSECKESFRVIAVNV